MGKPEERGMGRRLRELRLERGLRQAVVAGRLGVSPAYLSLIEKGKRTLQLPLLFDVLELYGVGVEDFIASLGERRLDEGLAKLLDDPLARTLDLSREELESMDAEPRVATTIAALFNLYKNTRGQLDRLLADLARRERDDPGAQSGLGFDYSPFDEVTDFLEAHGNYFPALEARADALRAEVGLPSSPNVRALVAALESLGVTVRPVGERPDSSVIRRLEPEEKVLTVARDMGARRLEFQLAHAIGLELLDAEALLGEVVGDRELRHAETRPLIKIHLANYLAGALLLPYGPFFEEVTRARYDVERLTRVFSSTYETVDHRICNLSDPERRGVPFHFLRVDVAGNISKRYSATGLRFPHGTGSCPKWAVHTAFLTPHAVHKQYSVFPDGATYFCFARVIAEPLHGSLARGTVYAIGLGTDADNARHLAYADDMPFVDPRRMSVPVGTTCRFCERTDCNQRAAPSYKFAFRVDEYVKKDNFFSPLVTRDSAGDDG